MRVQGARGVELSAYVAADSGGAVQLLGVARHNYLFCGSDEGARRHAIISTVLGNLRTLHVERGGAAAAQEGPRIQVALGRSARRIMRGAHRIVGAERARVVGAPGSWTDRAVRRLTDPLARCHRPPEAQ